MCVGGGGEGSEQWYAPNSNANPRIAPADPGTRQQPVLGSGNGDLSPSSSPRFPRGMGIATHEGGTPDAGPRASAVISPPPNGPAKRRLQKPLRSLDPRRRNEALPPFPAMMGWRTPSPKCTLRFKDRSCPMLRLSHKAMW